MESRDIDNAPAPGVNGGVFDNASEAWQHQLKLVVEKGTEVSPRGKDTLEVLHPNLCVNMNKPNVLVPERGLGYRFMAAEALWMIDGDDRVETIAPYNDNIAQFSDDGETFFGAYGPRVRQQEEYVLQKLVSDEDTRQAVMTIWRRNPPESRDIPCTVALDFKIRDGLLNCHAFMRSSDTYLGLPYDIFNFSMIATWIACMYNQHLADRGVDRAPVGLGNLYWCASSSHVYVDPPGFSYTMDDVVRCAKADTLHTPGGGDTAYLTPTPIKNTWVTAGMSGWMQIRRCLETARDGDVWDQADRPFRVRPILFDDISATTGTSK